jgi:hypothetical protein
VFEAEFMLPWNFSEEATAEKHMAQLQHNMWVTASRTAVLSVITGGGKWVEMTIPAEALYQHLLLTAERKFWRCVQSGEPPRLFGIEPPRPRVEAVRSVDMSGSNAWAEFANLYRLTRPAALDHDRAKVELKALVPEDAKEAAGHGVRPLHHRELHRRGDERAWWQHQGIEPLNIAATLWATTHAAPQAETEIEGEKDRPAEFNRQLNGRQFGEGAAVADRRQNDETKPIRRPELG